jgi:uridine kinase
MGVVDELAAAILALQRQRPVRVLIEGRSAAGKTTFSRTLAERLGRSGRQAQVVHLDDFHPVGYRPLGSAAYTPERYLQRGFDFAAFERLVLEPTREGGDGAISFALPGGFEDSPAGGTTLGVGALLIVEGVFLLKPGLRHWWDFVIWLDVSFATMVRRATARDVAWVGDADLVRHRYETFWTATHALYETGDPRGAAHAVIDNEDPATPRLVRPVASGASAP